MIAAMIADIDSWLRQKGRKQKAEGRCTVQLQVTVTCKNATVLYDLRIISTAGCVILCAVVHVKTSKTRNVFQPSSCNKSYY